MKNRRLVNGLQILTIVLFFACGLGTGCSLAARPRSEALERFHEPIPPEWEWVLINHGEVYPWPFGRRAFPFFGVGFVASMAFLILSSMYAEDWSPGKPLFGWLKPWK